MFERYDHAVVVGYGVGLQLGHPAKSWIRAGSNRRARALRGGKGTKTVGIRVGIKYELVNSVMTEVAEADRSARAKGLLPLQAPPLKLWRVNRAYRGGNSGRKESVWIDFGNRGLNLRESLSGREAVDKRCIRSGRIFE